MILRRSILALAAGLAVLALPCHVRAAGPKVRVHTVDARTFTGPLVRIDANSVVLGGEQGPQTLSLSQITDVIFPPLVRSELDRTGRGAVRTWVGDEVLADKIESADSSVRFRHDLLGTMTVKLADLAVVSLPSFQYAPSAIEARCQELRLTDAPMDLLVVAKSPEEWVSVQGVLVAAGPEKVTFRWRDADRTIDRKQVVCIRLAAVEARQAETLGQAVLTDGSRVVLNSLQSDGRYLSFASPLLGEHKISLERVGRLTLRPPGMTALTDLKPVAVKEQGFFRTTFPHRVGLSVSGEPMRLEGQTYQTGLGLHSFSQLTYDLGGQYKQFVALAGIDDAVRPLGDATVTFLGDDKPLGEPIRLTGKDSILPVRLDVQGVKRFTIRVDFGADKIGAADHVNLALARLLK